MNIVAIIDSFKETISSLTLSSIVKKELELIGHKVKSIPISDGGEGFIDSIKTCFTMDSFVVETTGPLGDLVSCEYILKNNTAYIEMNIAAGISRISKDRLNPLLTSTKGVGEIIKDSIQRGAKEIIIGVGGSSTNDGGAGMLQALGVKFYHEEKLIEEEMTGELIRQVTSFDVSQLKQNIKGIKFVIASDVVNPLLGKNGCSLIYSPQKGASKDQVNRLEENMTNFAQVVEAHFNKSFANSSGAGAAGGMGFGCLAFLNARITSGIDMMIKLLDLEKHIQGADLVIVGEGKLDNQTKNGKAPLGIAKLAKKYNKKVIGVFALIDTSVEYDYFDEVISIVPQYATMEESITNPETNFIKMIKNIRI